MAETTQASQSQAKPAQQPAQPKSVVLDARLGARPMVVLTGLVDSCNQVAQTKDGMPIYETVLLLPAADPYSYPRRYCVSSDYRFGRGGQEVTVEVELQCNPWKDNKGRFHYPHSLWARRQ